MGQASNGLVNQLQADVHPTICITLPRMIRFLIAAAYLLLSKFISLLIVCNTTLVQMAGREVIGIIVHVPPCHCMHLFHHIIIVWLGTVPFCLASPDNFRMNTGCGRYGATYNMVGLSFFNDKLSCV
jgi:hypothetical protein